jgi:phosphopantetheinyl transferase
MTNLKPNVLYIIDAERWHPSEEEWRCRLSLLSSVERDRISRFKRPIGNGQFRTGPENADAKLSLLGRLMIRHVCARHLRLPSASLVRLDRTKFGKPILINDDNEDSDRQTSTANFSFNVSHTDGLVAMISSDQLQTRVGIDIACMRIPTRGTRANCEPMHEFFSHFQLDVFTAREWQTILRPTNVGAVCATLEFHQTAVDLFFIHWALKECYVKAVGEGIGFGLTKIEFELCWREPVGVATTSRLPDYATMRLNGELVKNVRFTLIYGSIVDDNNEFVRQSNVVFENNQREKPLYCIAIAIINDNNTDDDDDDNTSFDLENIQSLKAEFV